MGNYMDNTYAAVDGVILSYSGKEVSLSVPKRLANMDVRSIGIGAFMQSEKLQQVALLAGIERIGSQSFCGCPNLMNVYIPETVNAVEKGAFYGCDRIVNLNIYDYPLNERAYFDLRASSASVNGTHYLAHAFPEDKRIRDIVGTTDFNPANPVPCGIRRLFTSQSMTKKRELRR